MNKSIFSHLSFHTKVLLLALFGVMILALLYLSYVKRENFVFFNNELQKADLSYQLFDTLELEAQSVYVYNFTTQSVLYKKNSLDKKGIASLTKLMTALLSDEFDQEKKITILPGMIIHDDQVPFSLGQIWNKYIIEKMMLVASSNNAAEVLAQNTSLHTKKDPVSLMNDVAKKYFLENISFNNPTGLDEGDIITTNIGTAEDITKLAYISYRKIPEIVSATLKDSYEFKTPSGSSYTVFNTNPIVKNIPNIELSKTGYTIQSGGNLTILYRSKYNNELIGITVLGSTKDGRFSDMLKLVHSTDLFLEVYNNRKLSQAI